jgi:hypothetical protein
MPKKQSGIPKDVNQNAAGIVALTTGQDVPTNVSDAEKRRRSEAASILGKLGGLKGAKARAKSLSASPRKQIARNAAGKRWKAPALSQKHKYRLANGLYCIVNSSPENL